ncbi:hypothetical protein G6F31_019285 [Rhizopus arrhizus]|nr:hypothetical protein G6F31_019285 [Rhizopus arrhizus]
MAAGPQPCHRSGRRQQRARGDEQGALRIQLPHGGQMQDRDPARQPHHALHRQQERPGQWLQRMVALRAPAMAHGQDHGGGPGADHGDGQPHDAGQGGIEIQPRLQEVVAHQLGRQAAPDQAGSGPGDQHAGQETQDHIGTQHVDGRGHQQH